MNDFLTTPPERRTPPPELRDEIMARIEAEPAARRRGRWPVLLVAASLVAVAGAGGMALQRQGSDQTPAESPSPVSTPDTNSSQATAWRPVVTGKKLAESCRDAMPGQGWIGQPLLSPSGNAVVLRSAKTMGVCIGTETGQATTLFDLKTGPDGVRVVHESEGKPAHQVIAVAGPVPKGIVDGMLNGRDPVAVGNGMWIGDRTVDQAGLASQPDVMWVMLDQRAETANPISYGFEWPGRQQVVALAGPAVVKACTELDPAVAPASPEFHQTQQGHAVLMAGGDRAVLCTAKPGSTMYATTPLKGTGIYQLAAVTDYDSTNVMALAGKLPAGVTRVAIRTPRGLVPATISGGWWVWEDVVPLRHEGWEPKKLWLEMDGGHSQWVEWKNFDAPGSQADKVSSLQGPATGQLLEKECTSAESGSKVLLHSAQGHVVVLTGSQGSAACTANKGFVYTSGWTARPALDKETFAITSSSKDGGPGIAMAGGKLPADVTTVTYNAPDGPIPAVVKDGHWAFEQTLTTWDSSKLPTSVTVTGPGLQRTITLR